jgi:DMSO/TMAO reductase YedYZ molybdopterin-dependent catalytic subunit
MSVKHTTSRHVAIVLVVIVALAIAVIALAQANRSHVKVSTGSIAVTYDGKTIKAFTMAQVQRLPSVRVRKTIHSSSHPTETGTFTGVLLRTLIDAADSALLHSATQIVTRGSDGFVSVLDPSEVSKGDHVLLAYAEDGRSLGTSRNGGTGPFRIIVVTDTWGNRDTKWVNEIQIMK